MSCWYSMEGTLKVEGHHPEVLEIVEEFNDLSGEIQADYDSDAGTVEVCGGDQMSYTNATELDDILKKLSPYTIEPGQIQCNLDNNEITFLYIGKPEKERDYQSAQTYQEIVDLLDELTPAHKTQLLNLLQEKTP